MLVTCALSRWELRGWFAGARTCVLVYMARRCCQPTRATVSNFPRLHCHCIIYFPNIIRFMFHHFMSKTSVIKRISYNGCISLPRSTAIEQCQWWFMWGGWGGRSRDEHEQRRRSTWSLSWHRLSGHMEADAAESAVRPRPAHLSLCPALPSIFRNHEM